MQRRPGSYGEATDRALSLWVVLSRAYRAMARRAEEDIRARGLAPTEWAVLEYLYHKGTQPLAQIGERILVTGGSVTYVVDKLEQRGLLRRERCTKDRRVIYAVLTEAGREIMAAEFPGHARVIREFADILEPHEQEQVRTLLKMLGLQTRHLPPGDPETEEQQENHPEERRAEAVR